MTYQAQCRMVSSWPVVRRHAYSEQNKERFMKSICQRLSAIRPLPIPKHILLLKGHFATHIAWSIKGHRHGSQAARRLS
jgi:hypothetical protein